MKKKRAFADMPIRLENMVTANIENNSNQSDLKDNIEWLSHGLKETLKLHQCGQTRSRTEFGHNVMSTMMATSTTSIITNNDMSSSSNNNNNNNTHYTSLHLNNNSMSKTFLEMDRIVHHPTKQLHCSPNKRTPIINEIMSSVVQGRHVSKMKTNSHHKWVHQNNRVNKKNMRRRRRTSHNIYIEDVRLGIQGKNTDYYHHQKFLSTQTLIQEAVKRLCDLHNNTTNIINPNSTTKTATTPGGVDMTNNGSNINNINNSGIVHQQHSATTLCNINFSNANSQFHMGLAGVV